MKIIDLDNQTAIEVPARVALHFWTKYPVDDYPGMYDLDGDICLDETEYRDIVKKLPAMLK